MGADNVVARVRRILCRRNLDGILISQPENRRYLSGYTALDHGIEESSGFLLIPAKGCPYLLTDSRFTLQAAEEAPQFIIRQYKKGLFDELKSLGGELGIRSLAFESNYILYASYKRLRIVAKEAGIRLRATSGFVEGLREVKDERELDLIRQSSRLNEKVFQQVYQGIRIGQTEREIALTIESTMRQMGAERPSFDTIVAFGTNAAKPHAVPSDRTLKAGETVLVDMGLVYKGYCSDLSRTFVLGQPDELYLKRHQLVRQAQLAGIARIRAGATGKEVDAAARQVLADGGYAEAFGHGLGHGVGLAVHESPRLSPLGEKKLRVGMVVTVEPGLYLADWGGIRLENMVVVQKNGSEVLNTDATFLDIAK